VQQPNGQVILGDGQDMVPLDWMQALLSKLMAHHLVAKEPVAA
jgi:hypothetical protein